MAVDTGQVIFPAGQGDPVSTYSGRPWSGQEIGISSLYTSDAGDLGRRGFNQVGLGEGTGL